MIYTFNKKWKELNDDEVSKVCKNGNIIVVKSDDEIGGKRFSIFRYEIFPKAYNSELLGGGDISFKAHVFDLELAESICKIIEKIPLPYRSTDLK